MKSKSSSICKFLFAAIFFNSILLGVSANDQTAPTTCSQSLTFEDPAAALPVLEQLDIFEQLDVTEEELANNFSLANVKFARDNNYCKKHRAFFVNNPEVVFEQTHILMTGIAAGPFIRKNVIPLIGTDIKDATSDERTWKVPYDLSLNITNILSFRPINLGAAIGHHYSCLGQESSSIPGSPHLSRKDFMAEASNRYAENFKTRPQCFSNDKFFPKTWALYNKEECTEFFDNFNSLEYQKLKQERGVVYLRKIGAGVHEGKGVFPFNQKDEIYVKELYQNGLLCGNVQKNNLMQYLIYNPLLINGHKCDFRTYLLIASTNPVIAYYTHGFIRVSINNYDPITSQEKSAFLTNFKLARATFAAENQNGTYNGKTLSDLVKTYLWTQEDLQTYLLEVGKVEDPNWLNNYLRPEIRRACAHLIRMTQDKFLKKSSLYQMFGVDFMLDENLKLWFIEANKSPGLGTPEDPERMGMIDINMVKDHFEIVYGLLRSRMKRVVQFVNNLVNSEDVEKISSSQVVIKNLEAKREEFARITQNYFEPEYEPRADNCWQPVINENYEGAARYFNLFSEECI